MILKKVGILQIDFLNMGSLLQTTILRTNSKIVGFVLLEIFYAEFKLPISELKYFSVLNKLEKFFKILIFSNFLKIDSCA